jgi:hypothetical protein
VKPKADFLPHAESEAAMLLAGGIADRARERVSLRELGRRLEYKQPVVLSHMATGRVPIPIDRAIDIARVVGLPPRRFLLTVLEQRHPGIDWSMLEESPGGFAAELETIAAKPLDELPADTKSVLRETVIDPQPSRRWLTTAEVPVVELIRRLRPSVTADGLKPSDWTAVRNSLEASD